MREGDVGAHPVALAVRPGAEVVGELLGEPAFDALGGDGDQVGDERVIWWLGEDRGEAGDERVTGLRAVHVHPRLRPARHNPLSCSVRHQSNPDGVSQPGRTVSTEW